MIFSIESAPPITMESAAQSPDAAADELEWLALEAKSMRLTLGGVVYYVDQPRVIRHVTTWTETGIGATKWHPRAYRVKGESAGLPRRATSPLYAARQFEAFPTATYLPPQLGPWPRSSVKWAQLHHGCRDLRYNPNTRTWK